MPTHPTFTHNQIYKFLFNMRFVKIANITNKIEKAVTDNNNLKKGS